METATAPHLGEDILPPVEPRTVFRTGLVGAGLCAGAAVLGLVALGLGDSVPWPLQSARLVLAGLGCLIAGSAISLRPALWQGWAIAAGAVLLTAIIGLPEHWDSGRLFARVLTAIFAAGAALSAMTPTWRFSLLSLATMFHFGGIFTATTWPDPTPWLSNQIGHRIYMPYLSFLYLRNAYHFYSPEPGPASLLVCLLKYELDTIDPATGKPQIVYEWITMPRRDEHMKDPLGQTYYRRLSLTEMISMGIPGLVTSGNFESLDAYGRRQRASVLASGTAREAIPMNLRDEPAANQYRIPQPHISRYLLPSYAKHIADEYSGPGRKVVSVKMYRIEHRIVTAAAFVGGWDPFDPRTYRPYFYGEYDATGKLLDPQDEMLYWLVPIMTKPEGPSPSDPEQRTYIDYLSKHAGYEFDWRRIRP